MAKGAIRFETAQRITLILIASCALFQLTGSPVVAQPADSSQSAPNTISGSAQDSTLIANAIGTDPGKSPDYASAITLAAKPDSNISPEDRDSILSEAAAMMTFLGKPDGAGDALLARYQTYENSAGRDLKWAGLADDYAKWLLSQNRGAEAIPIAKDALAVAKSELGEKAAGLMPFLLTLSQAQKQGGGSKYEIATLGREIARLQPLGGDELTTTIVMGENRAAPPKVGQQAVQKVRIYYETTRHRMRQTNGSRPICSAARLAFRIMA